MSDERKKVRDKFDGYRDQGYRNIQIEMYVDEVGTPIAFYSGEDEDPNHIELTKFALMKASIMVAIMSGTTVTEFLNMQNEFVQSLPEDFFDGSKLEYTKKNLN